MAWPWPDSPRERSRHARILQAKRAEGQDRRYAEALAICESWVDIGAVIPDVYPMYVHWLNWLGCPHRARHGVTHTMDGRDPDPEDDSVDRCARAGWPGEIEYDEEWFAGR